MIANPMNFFLWALAASFFLLITVAIYTHAFWWAAGMIAFAVWVLWFVWEITRGS